MNVGYDAIGGARGDVINQKSSLISISICLPETAYCVKITPIVIEKLLDEAVATA